MWCILAAVSFSLLLALGGFACGYVHAFDIMLKRQIANLERRVAEATARGVS